MDMRAHTVEEKDAVDAEHDLLEQEQTIHAALRTNLSSLRDRWSASGGKSDLEELERADFLLEQLAEVIERRGQIAQERGQRLQALTGQLEG